MQICQNFHEDKNSVLNQLLNAAKFKIIIYNEGLAKTTKKHQGVSRSHHISSPVYLVHRSKSSQVFY